MNRRRFVCAFSFLNRDVAEAISERDAERIIAGPMHAVVEHLKSEHAHQCVSERTNERVFRIVFRNDRDRRHRGSQVARRKRVVGGNMVGVINLVGKEMPRASRRGGRERALAARDVFKRLNNRAASNNCFGHLARGLQCAIVRLDQTDRQETSRDDDVGPPVAEKIQRASRIERTFDIEFCFLSGKSNAGVRLVVLRVGDADFVTLVVGLVADVLICNDQKSGRRR